MSHTPPPKGPKATIASCQLYDLLGLRYGREGLHACAKYLGASPVAVLLWAEGKERPAPRFLTPISDRYRIAVTSWERPA